MRKVNSLARVAISNISVNKNNTEIDNATN